MDTLATKLDLLVKNLRTNKETISFAESCTGGKLSARLTEIPGVSDLFMGTVVSYSNSAKEDILGVLRDTILNHGAVSEVVALQMASGVQSRIKSDWAGAITGVAGPGGGTVDKPVGTVCFAIIGPDIEWSAKSYFKGDRKKVQEQSIEFLTDQLNKIISKHRTKKI